jgi:hypothetical protein
MQLATALFLVSAVLSLGPHLSIDARSTDIPMPFLIVSHVPLLNDVLPARFSLEMFACLAAMVAFGLDDMQRSSPRPAWLTGRVAAGAFLAVFVVTQLPQWPYGTWSQPTLPSAIRAAIPNENPVTLTYPYPTGFTTQALTWQMDNGYKFRLLGGYAHATNPNGVMVTTRLLTPSALERALAGQPLALSPEAVSGARATLFRYDVGLVIVDRSQPGSAQVAKLISEAVGPPRVSSDHFSLWTGWDEHR